MSQGEVEVQVHNPDSSPEVSPLPPIVPTTQAQQSTDSAFTLFVSKALKKLQHDCRSRGAEYRALRHACQEVSGRLQSGDIRLSSPLESEATSALLEPLLLACSIENQRIQETALGCLHKCIAHAWLQGESNNNKDNIVSSVINSISHCGENPSAKVQLAVVKALLTACTAEHFVPHSDALMQAVRTLFNLAVGSDEPSIQRTARSSLLQIMHTVCKRISHPEMWSPNSTPQPTPQHSMEAQEVNNIFEIVQQQQLVEDKQDPIAFSHHGESSVQENNQEDQAEGLGGQEQEETTQQISAPEVTRSGVDAALRVAKLACLAEQGDLQGLELALQGDDGTNNQQSSQSIPAEENGQNEQQTENPEQLSPIESAPVPSTLTNGSQEHQPKPEISVLERDVLAVVRSLCKLAEREAGTGMVEVYMAEGKLLALELLVKMFLNPSKDSWNYGSVRFYRELRKPLCLALLKNALGTDDQVYYWTVRLFLAILLLPKLRLGLKAELGAFLPLLVLRPLETGSSRPKQTTSAIQVLQRICSESQLLVDFFVNFDCEYNAGNLYERMVKVLARLAQDTEVLSARPEEVQALKVAAGNALITVVNSIDAWAGPIRDATALNLGRIGSGETQSIENGDLVSEVERLEQAKSKKESYAAAIALFNRNGIKGMQALIRGGHVKEDPVAVAKFIREALKRSEINREQVGEYFGYHEEFEIAVMHAFIDAESYQDVTIDVALRTLLGKFKIPGEAQKIDRISEKFAAKYCNDNPSIFKNVDAAYMLTFAIIMLNTDAHNPVAEKRLDSQSFILMNQNPETEEYALPVQDLTGIFDRVTAEEIIMQGDDNNSYSSQLAAAMGQTWLALPFKMDYMWDKNWRAQLAEQRYVAESKVAMRQSGRWQSGSDAENVRPMLQVSGTSILEGLRAIMRDASSLTLVRQTLDALARLAKLSSMLRLYELCDAAVSTMADNTGVFDPAPPNSFAEQRQLMSLKSVVELGSGKEASLLGNAWGVVLNCLSALEILSQRLGEDINLGNDQYAGITMNKILNVIGYSASTTGINPQTQPVLARFIRSGTQGNTQLGGHLLVKWSRGEGSAAVDKVYAASGELDGDAVLIFVKQLVAISATELKFEKPQVFSLQKLVECVYHNLGRIRLVWSRIWQLVCPHLVSSACIPQLEVGLYAVDSLKQLVGKLLSRKQLVDFSFQEELLSPFVEVLKFGPLPEVRELALQCTQQILESHSKALDSKGCLVLLKVLTVASADMSPMLLRHLVLPVQVMLNLFGQDQQQMGSQHLPFLLRLLVVGCHNPEVGSHFLRLFPQCLVRVQQLGVSECSSELLDAARQGVEESERVEHLVLERDMVLNWFPKWMMYQDPWLSSLGAMAEVAQQVQMEPIADEVAQSMFAAIDTYGAAMGWPESTWQGLVRDIICPWLTFQDQYSNQEWKLTRLRKHSGNHLPHFFTHLSAFYSKIQWYSLLLLVQLVLQYIWSQDVQTAMLGISLIKVLAQAIGSQLDKQGWNVLLCGLQLATLHFSSEDVLDILKLAATNLQNQDFSINVPSNLLLDEDGVSGADQLRERCHINLMMLRCIDKIHEYTFKTLPQFVEIQLINIVKGAVNTAISYSTENHFSSQDQSIETLPSLSTHYRKQSQQAQVDQNQGNQVINSIAENSVQEDIEQSPQEEQDGWVKVIQEPQETDVDENKQQLQQQEKQTQSQESAFALEADDGMTRLRISRSTVNQQQIILLRQLVEGGLLLIKIMQRTLESGASEIVSQRRKAVEEKLTQFCQDVLQKASQDQQWQSSNVSALIVQSLQVTSTYQSVAGFQDLSLLIKSRQQDVRNQLSELLNSLYSSQI